MHGEIGPRDSAEGKSRRPRSAIAKPRENAKLSHNLNGQRLGRKGRDTRQRIIDAAVGVMEDPTDENGLTLSEVARRAGMSMGSLYNYFGDLSELMTAVLEPIMQSAEDEYIHFLRPHWADDALARHTLVFATAYFSFWKKYARILHMRNSMADRGDQRMSDHRTKAALSAISLMSEQMGGVPAQRGTLKAAMSTTLITGLERIATVMSAPKLPLLTGESANSIDYLLQAQARLLEMAIRDMRERP